MGWRTRYTVSANASNRGEAFIGESSALGAGGEVKAFGTRWALSTLNARPSPLQPLGAESP
jgi:hypothetical protein